jgi:hypothetical protein
MKERNDDGRKPHHDVVELDGYRRNLDDWQRVFQDRTIASVELSAGRAGEPAYFVHSQRFDGVRDTEAHGVATKLLAQMNGAAALCGHQSALWSPERTDGEALVRSFP